MNASLKSPRKNSPNSTSPCRYWANLTTQDFLALDTARTIAVLPVAATEQHGPHLPLSVDTVIVDSVVQAGMPQMANGLSVLIQIGRAHV